MSKVIVSLFSQLSNIANGIAIVTFFAYIAGRFWKIYNSKIFIDEQFIFEDFQNIQGNIHDADVYMDFGGQDIFAVSSPSGIRTIKAYRVNIENWKTETLSSNKIFLGQKNNINKNQKCYIQTYIPCGMPDSYLQIEIEREDYMIFSFTVSRSQKDNFPLNSQESIIKNHCEYKMTLKSWLYYLCS